MATGLKNPCSHSCAPPFQRIAANTPREAVFGDGHIGLLNTFMRLHYYSRGKIHMYIYNDGGAVVELTLPRQAEEE